MCCGFKIIGGKKIDVFNPVSIMQNMYLKKKDSQRALFASVTPSKEFFGNETTKMFIKTFVNNEDIQMEFKRKSFDFWDLVSLERFFTAKHNDLLDLHELHLFLEYLLVDGYLTTNGYSSEPSDRTIIIPNLAIRNYLKTI